MTTLTRKQREIAEREARILEVARQMLAERGYLGLTMDRVAEEIEYSKGTVYQHFSCKEELLAALSEQSAETRLELFERATTFRGRPRERMSAIGMADALFVRLYPNHFQLEKILTTHSIREKASADRMATLEACDMRCTQALTGLIRDAVAQGDLELASPQEGAQLAFGLWAMAFGAHLLASSPDLQLAHKMGIDDPQASMDANYHRFLDGFGWRPLSSEWDYAATMRRIQDEVFPEETRRLSAHVSRS